MPARRANDPFLLDQLSARGQENDDYSIKKVGQAATSNVIPRPL